MEDYKVLRLGLYRCLDSTTALASQKAAKEKIGSWIEKLYSAREGALGVFSRYRITWWKESPIRVKPGVK